MARGTWGPNRLGVHGSDSPPAQLNAPAVHESPWTHRRVHVFPLNDKKGCPSESDSAPWRPTRWPRHLSGVSRWVGCQSGSHAAPAQVAARGTAAPGISRPRAFDPVRSTPRGPILVAPPPASHAPEPSESIAEMGQRRAVRGSSKSSSEKEECVVRRSGFPRLTPRHDDPLPRSRQA